MIDCLVIKPVLTIRTIRVNTYDIDFAGVVSNIVYVRWMEDMRIAMTEAPHYLPLISLMAGQDGIAPAVLETQIKYRRSILLGDVVIGKAWLAALTHRKIDVAYEFYVENKLAASGRQSGCFINISTKRLARTPPEWISIYKQSLLEETL